MTPVALALGGGGRWSNPGHRVAVADELPTVPGLVVVRWASGIHTLTHEPSGRGLSGVCSLSRCRRLAEALADVTDWTQSAAQLAAENVDGKIWLAIDRESDRLPLLLHMSRATQRRLAERGW